MNRGTDNNRAVSERSRKRAKNETAEPLPPPRSGALPPPIIVHFNPPRPLEGLTEAEKAYISSRMRDRDRKQINSVMRDISSQNPEPLRIRVLRSKIPFAARGVIFRRLSNCDNDKYVDWVERVLRIPLGTYSAPTDQDHRTVICRAQTIMDDAITGHRDAKTAVLHMLCAWLRNGAGGGFSLALEGAPGTGKTTFVKDALAKCVNRPFFFISLGGASDASSLVGHSYTYEGAIPGRIAECVAEAGVMDPVIFFDELDKVSTTSKGAEIINTLIHLVDPTQNTHIRDKYFHGIDLDLSRAIMVFSYNDGARVDPVLLDSLKRVRMNAPTLEQKCEITRKHLFPRLLNRMSMQLDIPDHIISHIVKRHMHEAGMRGVEKSVNAIVSSLALAQMYGDASILGDSFKEARLTSHFIDTIVASDDDVAINTAPPLLMYT